jgi:glutaminase
MALVMKEQGPEAIQKKIGVEPTGLPFNSIVAIELNPQRSANPMVNAGAIACVSMVQAGSPEERWQKILNSYGDFAGEPLHLMDDVYKSEAESNEGNRAIAALLLKYKRIYSNPDEAVDVYTRQCSVGINAKQLAVMGATLANDGLNPITRKQVVPPELIPKILAVMMTCGFYDESGLWAYYAGLPGKTGVGGGIVAVVPGKMAIVGFSPPLNEAGNSVRSADAIQFIANQVGLNVFAHGRPTPKNPVEPIVEPTGR